MSLPTYQAVGTAVEAQGYNVGGGEPVNEPWSIIASWPTHQAGDIAILKLYCSTTTAVTLSGSGWTLIQSVSHSTASLHVWWKRASSSSETSVALTQNDFSANNDNAYAVITTYRGCVGSGDPINTMASSTRTTSTSCTFPTITSTEADCLILLIASRDNDSASAAWSAQTNASLGSITERFDGGTTLGDGGGLSLTEGTLVSAGATGTTSSTVTSSAGSMLTFALRGILSTPTDTSSFFSFFS